jgi:hypothetical protein
LPKQEAKPTSNKPPMINKIQLINYGLIIKTDGTPQSYLRSSNDFQLSRLMSINLVSPEKANYYLYLFTIAKLLDVFSKVTAL